MSDSFDKLPPFDGPSEQALLGCFMPALDAARGMELMTKCLDQFGSDEVFYDLRHQTIWTAMTYLKSKESRFDLITLQAELKDRGQLDQIGGVAYLSECQDAAGSLMQFEQYQQIVWEKFIARRLIQKNHAQIEAVMATGGISEAFAAQTDVRHQEWRKLFERGNIQPKNLSRPTDFAEQYYNQFFERKDDSYGWALPFEYTLRLRPGETTLFTGDNGSGKTSMLDLIAVVVAKQLAAGEKVVVASMEMRPEVTLWIMARQLLGLGKLDRTEENIARIVRALAWLNERVLLYNFWGITDKNDLLNTFHYAAENHKGRFFIIDNMMKVGIADDDYAAQGYFIQSVTAFSMKHQAHTIVVVHENKGDGSVKQRVRGSKQLTDAVDNVAKMERNEKKAEKLRELEQEVRAGLKSKEEFGRQREAMRKEWDSKFTHSKQRYPGTNQNGSRWLYFHHETLQFHEEPHLGPIDYTMA